MIGALRRANAFRRDRRLDDPGPFDPARGDDLRFPDPGGANLVLVEPGPVPLGHRHRSGGISVPPGNDQAPLGGAFDPARAATPAGMGEREQHHGGAGSQEALAFGL